MELAERPSRGMSAARPKNEPVRPPCLASAICTTAAGICDDPRGDDRCDPRGGRGRSARAAVVGRRVRRDRRRRPAHVLPRSSSGSASGSDHRPRLCCGPPSSRRHRFGPRSAPPPPPHAASPGRRRSSPARPPNERSSSRGGCAGWGVPCAIRRARGGDSPDLSRLASRDRGRDRPRSSSSPCSCSCSCSWRRSGTLPPLPMLPMLPMFSVFLVPLVPPVPLLPPAAAATLRLEDRDRGSVRETDRCFRSFLSLLCRFSLFSLLLRLRLRLEERDRESVRETDSGATHLLP